MPYDRTFRITKAVFYRLNPIPMEEPFQDATLAVPFTQVSGTCWLQLFDEDGTMGQGSASPGFLKDILPLLFTKGREDYGALYDRIFWANRNSGFSGPAFSALGSLDVILNDIMSKRAGIPLHRFLGATRDWVNVHASGHSTHKTIPEMVEEAQRWKELGYTVYKMKIGTDFGRKQDLDVERVRVMRETIGSDAKLALDANQLWTADEAMRFLDKVEKYNICWYEEPVHSHDLAELEKLCKLCPIPVAMGESLRNHYFFKAYMDAGVTHLQANPPLMGYLDWSAVRDMAKANGLMFSSNGVIASSFIATCDEECYQEHLRPRRDPVLKIMKKRPIEDKAKFLLPTEPGTSLEPDWGLLRDRNLLHSVEYFYNA